MREGQRGEGSAARVGQREEGGILRTCAPATSTRWSVLAVPEGRKVGDYSGWRVGAVGAGERQVDFDEVPQVICKRGRQRPANRAPSKAYVEL